MAARPAARERLFSVDEVNALIPRLEIVMSKLQRHGVQLRQHVGELARETGQTVEDLTTAHIVELRPELQPALEEVDALLSEIESYGGHLKGLDLGLVDFPAEIDGEIALLCWQYGEKEVAFYHSLDSGFASRKPLDAQLPRPQYLQ